MGELFKPTYKQDKDWHISLVHVVNTERAMGGRSLNLFHGL